MDRTSDIVRALRAARALLNLSQSDVAKLARVSRIKIIRMENADGGVSLSTLESVRAAYEREGVEFLPSTDERGPGVAVRKAASGERDEVNAVSPP